MIFNKYLKIKIAKQNIISEKFYLIILYGISNMFSPKKLASPRNLIDEIIEHHVRKPSPL